MYEVRGLIPSAISMPTPQKQNNNIWENKDATFFQIVWYEKI